MTEDYVEEYGLDLYDHVDVGGLLLNNPGEATVGIFVRDDIDEYVSISDENYVKLLLKLRDDVDKQLVRFGWKNERAVGEEGETSVGEEVEEVEE